MKFLYSLTLGERGVKQRYCVVVNVPNMRDMYGVYYDFGFHCSQENNWAGTSVFVNFAMHHFDLDTAEATMQFLTSLKPIGYRGVFNEEKDGSQIHLSSIERKTDRPIFFIAYNLDAYSRHCRTYAEYQR